MQQIVNGRVIHVPDEGFDMVNSDTIRRSAGVPTTRALIKQGPDGRNELINPGQMVPAHEAANFIDAPQHKRG